MEVFLWMDEENIEKTAQHIRQEVKVSTQMGL